MDIKHVPQHVAFIMDGNRRWAKSRMMSIVTGHDKGAHVVEPLVEYAAEMGISYLTFWAFSTENWNRDKEEVKGLMDVFRSALNDPMMERLMANGVKVQVIGDISAFPKDVRGKVEEIVDKSKTNSKITVNFALNYGGRAEILHAINSLVSQKTFPITEEMVSKELYTKGQPDPDLIVRTGGEKRLSGYLPWQSVYSELYFTDCLWPEFDKKEFQKALSDFDHRERRFGK